MKCNFPVSSSQFLLFAFLLASLSAHAQQTIAPCSNGSMEERNIQMMGAPFGGGGSFHCELNDMCDADQKFLMPVVVH